MDATAQEGQKPTATVYDHVAVMLDQAVSVAWQKLGLHPDVVSGRIEQDLNQARVAIDLVTFLVSVLEPQVDDDDKRQLQTITRDLKVNYVQRQGGGA